MILTAGGVEVLRGAVGEELDGGECVAQAIFGQGDCEVGDVDLGPLPPELFRRMDVGAADAERLKHDVAGFGGGVRGGRRALARGKGMFRNCRTEMQRPRQSGAQGR